MAKKGPDGLLLKIGPRKTITLEEFLNPKTEGQLTRHIKRIEEYMVKNDLEVFDIYTAMIDKVDAMSGKGIFGRITSENDVSFARMGFLIAYAAKRAYSES